MKLVKSLPKYKCDFCKRRSVKSAMERHEKICFRNPDRYCELCKNTGYTGNDYDEPKVPCYYCKGFNKKMLEEIEARELSELPIPNEGEKI